MLHRIFISMLGLGISSASAMELGDPVDEAVALHITQAGLSKVGDMVQALVPQEIDVGAGTGTLECSESDRIPLSYSVDELTLRISADEVRVITESGKLTLELYATLWSDPSELSVSGDCAVLQSLDEVCDIELPVTSLSASLSVSISENDGRFDVLATDPIVAISPMGNPLANCTPASAMGTLLGQDEEFISDLILSFVQPELEGVAASLETALEDTFDQLTVSTAVSVGDTPIELSFYPSLVQLDETGLILGMGAEIGVDNPSDCVAWQDGFEAMDTGWPEFSEKAAGTQLGYHSGLFIGRDFVDHILLAFWSSGVLCLEVSDLNGAPLTAGLLENVWGEKLAEVLNPDATASLTVIPRNRPFVRFSDDDPVIRLQLEDLALEMVTELDYRPTRIFEAGVSGDVGLSIDLQTEALSLDLVFGAASLDFRDNWSKLAEPGYSKVVSDLAQAAIGTLLPDDLLPQVTLPYLLGLELDAVVWLPTPDDAWQGAYVLLDTENVQPIPLEGCSVDSVGCDGSSTFEFDLESALGCDSGEQLGCSDTGAACTVVPVPLGRVLPLGFVLLGLTVRRRSRSQS